METILRAIETTATIDDERHLLLDAPLPENANGRVRVIILFADDSEISEEEWLKAMSKNPAFSFLDNESQDIYTSNDGKPFYDKG